MPYKDTKHGLVNSRIFLQLTIILCWAHFNGFNDLDIHEIYCTVICISKGPQIVAIKNVGKIFLDKFTTWMLRDVGLTSIYGSGNSTKLGVEIEHSVYIVNTIFHHQYHHHHHHHHNHDNHQRLSKQQRGMVVLQTTLPPGGTGELHH